MSATDTRELAGLEGTTPGPYEGRDVRGMNTPAGCVLRATVAEAGERQTVVWADESKALHWIDRYAAGIDLDPQMDRILACVTVATAKHGGSNAAE